MAAPDGTFVCSGCREQIRICSPETGVIVVKCPIDNCRREIWALPAAGWASAGDRGVLLGAFAAPDLSRRFSVDQCRLLLDGLELISGPADLLEMFADYLNSADPPEAELPGRIRVLIQGSRAGCHFQPGRELVRIGMAARQTEPLV
jgi:hypothetical protein